MFHRSVHPTSSQALDKLLTSLHTTRATRIAFPKYIGCALAVLLAKGVRVCCPARHASCPSLRSVPETASEL